MSAGARGAVVLLAAAVAAASFLASAWTPALPGPQREHPADFQILWAAGQALDAGEDPTDPQVLDAYGRRAGRPVTPFAAALPLVLAGVARLGPDHDAAHRAWFAVNALALLLAVLLLACVLASAGLSGAWAAALALLLLAGDGSWHALAMNATTLPALLCVLGALLAAQHERPWLEGALLALAVLLKIAPLWLLVVAALAGRWRTLLAAGVGLALLGALALATVGPEPHLAWWQHVRPRLAYGATQLDGGFANSLHAWNLAPNGLLTRSLHAAGAGAGAAAALSWLVTLLVLAQTALLLRGRRDAAAPAGAAHAGHAPSVAATRASDAHRARAVTRLHEYGLGTAGALLASSVTWPHHLGFAAPALAALLLPWPPARARAAAALLLGLVLAWPMGRLDLDLELKLKSVALLLLFAALARHLARQPLERAPDADPPRAESDAAAPGARTPEARP